MRALVTILLLSMATTAHSYTLNAGGVPITLSHPTLVVAGKDRPANTATVRDTIINYLPATRTLYIQRRGMEMTVEKLPKPEMDKTGTTLLTRPGLQSDTVFYVYRIVTDKEVYEISEESFKDPNVVPALLSEAIKTFKLGG